MLLLGVPQKSPTSIVLNNSGKRMLAPMRCGLRCCLSTGVWRYLEVATGKIHTFLFARLSQKEKKNEKDDECCSRHERSEECLEKWQITYCRVYLPIDGVPIPFIRICARAFNGMFLGRGYFTSRRTKDHLHWR